MTVATATDSSPGAVPASVTWETDWDTAFRRARDERKVVLVKVEKHDHCIGCELLDEVVFPDPAVAALLADRFVCLRLEHTDPAARPLRVLWLPTVLVMDRMGVEHERSVNSLPPADLLDRLALGEAQARIREARYAEAERVLREALARRDGGPSRPELLYWLGIAVYWVGSHDHDARDDVWDDLLRTYPDSIWAHRTPQHLLGRRPDRH
jgi:hypothetical protein